jgi:hypothetical protein
VWREFQVVEEDTYEFLMASGASPDTDVALILADTNELQQDDYPARFATVDNYVQAILADTGTSGVLLGATATSAQLVDDVWDEAIEDHDTQGNAGWATALAVYAGPDGPGIFIDSGAANTSTVVGTDGTEINPVSTFVAARTLADELGMNIYYIEGNSDITLAATHIDWEFIGKGSVSDNIVNLGSQDVSRSLFRNLTLEGTQGGAGRITARDCALQDPGAGATTLHIFAERCGFVDEIEIDTSNDNVFDQCFSLVAGTAAPVIIATGAAGTISVRHYSGGLEFKSLSASHNVTWEGIGQVIFNANCNVNANVSVRGVGSITDNTAGMSSLTETSLVNMIKINTEADTALTDYGGALASVVGALNDAAAADDPTSADTLMQYIKQLINVLVGTDGVGTWPAEQAPANAVNFAEVLRAIHVRTAYAHNSIWIDTVNGAAGTTNYVNGTESNPVNSIADANTLATSLGISRFEIVPRSSITFAAAQANQVFHGEKWTLALGGQNVAGSTFIGAIVSGVMAGTGVMQKFIDCVVNATSVIKGTLFVDCQIANTITVVEAGEFLFRGCASSVAGAGAPTFDFGSALNSSNLSVRHCSGGWKIDYMGAGTGTYNATFEGHGQIVWQATCSATSNASIRGHWKITDNASGAVTETKDDITVDVDAVLVDTEDIQSRIPAALSSGNIKADALAISESTAAADKLEASAETIVTGAAEAGTLSTTEMTTDLTEATDDHFNGRVVIWTSGVLANQASDITDYLGSTGKLTYTAVTEAPSAADTFVIV